MEAYANISSTREIIHQYCILVDLAYHPLIYNTTSGWHDDIDSFNIVYSAYTGGPHIVKYIRV